MKPEMILQADILDIVFENRNKEYGAYALRKTYNQRLFHSLSGVLFVLIASLLFLYWKTNDPKKLYPPPVFPDDSIRLINIDESPPPPPVQPIAVVQPVKTVIVDPVPVIVPDIEVPERKEIVKDLANSVIGKENIDGPPAQPFAINPPGEANSASGKQQETAIVESPPVVLEIAEVMPEFPGGISAWLRFLQKNLRFPGDEDGIETSIKIAVHVKFVVNEDGSLTGLEIVQSGGKEFDEEVMRVMKKSPKWVAGSDKGKKVKIYRKQPIIFEHNAE